jgi:hypothetical protein
MECALQEFVWRRAGGRCDYCQVSPQDLELPFEIDHVIAVKHGGPTRASNLCLACFAYNHYKGSNISGFDGATNGIVPLFNPRRHKWHRHFRWQGPILIGRTPIGRVTILVLEINRPYRIDLRKGLIDEGIFPPE